MIYMVLANSGYGWNEQQVLSCDSHTNMPHTHEHMNTLSHTRHTNVKGEAPSKLRPHCDYILKVLKERVGSSSGNYLTSLI